MKLAWMTDLHLDQVETETKGRFLESLRTADYEAGVITGDISSPPLLARDLLALGKAAAPRGIFFVLGNHDIGDRAKDVEETVMVICRQQRNLRPVWRQGIIPLTRNSCLVGHHGGPDPNPEASRASEHFRSVLPQALSRFPRVWLLTHVPPFEQAVRFSGRMVWGEKRNAFVCRPAGRVIAGISRQFANRRVAVLAGHTHNGVQLSISPTVEITVGRATRGQPEIQGIFSVDSPSPSLASVPP